MQNVILLLIKSHCGIFHNEQADKLSKEECDFD